MYISIKIIAMSASPFATYIPSNLNLKPLDKDHLKRMQYARTHVYLPPSKIDRNHSSPLAMKEIEEDLASIIRMEKKRHLNVGNAGTLMVSSKRTLNVRFDGV